MGVHGTDRGRTQVPVASGVSHAATSQGPVPRREGRHDEEWCGAGPGQSYITLGSRKCPDTVEGLGGQ